MPTKFLKNLFLLSSTFAAHLLGGAIPTAHAEIVFAIDLDTDVPGVQSTRQARPFQTFDAFLTLSLTGDTRVSGYTISISFNPDEIDILAVDDSLRPDGWFSLADPTRNDSQSRIELINAGSFGFIDSGFSSPIAKLTLESRNPFLGNTELNIMPGFFNVNIDGVIDENGAPITTGVQFQGATVTAVPEPSTFFLSSVVAGLFYFRRKRAR